MIYNIIGLIIGILILGAGIFTFIKEKTDRESRKIYGITMGAGGDHHIVLHYQAGCSIGIYPMCQTCNCKTINTVYMISFISTASLIMILCKICVK